jgi:hypothetical protein
LKLFRHDEELGVVTAGGVTGGWKASRRSIAREGFLSQLLEPLECSTRGCLAASLIEASTATRVFSRKAADVTATEPWQIHTIGWLCPSFPLREGDMSNSRGIHVLKDVF